MSLEIHFSLINGNIEKSLLVPSDEALKRVTRMMVMYRVRVMFSVMYHPAYHPPSIPEPQVILHSHSE